MSFHFPTIQDVETELGIIKVDANAVIAKVVADIKIVETEAQALLQWGLGQAGTVQKYLTAAAPVISQVGAMATLAATGNPAAAATVAAAIKGVNDAMALAEASADAMNTANTAMQASANQGVLVSDTTALAAAVSSVTGATSHAANVMMAAVAAAKTIKALTPAPTAN